MLCLFFLIMGEDFTHMVERVMDNSEVTGIGMSSVNVQPIIAQH